jgi:HlyD family secretion protein
MRLKGGQPLDLKVGMSLTANIKLRKVTYLQLLLSDFKDKADALRRI